RVRRDLFRRPADGRLPRRRADGGRRDSRRVRGRADRAADPAAHHPLRGDRDRARPVGAAGRPSPRTRVTTTDTRDRPARSWRTSLATFLRSNVTSSLTTAVDFGTLAALATGLHVDYVLATWLGT